ncbi:MAG: glycine zipper 2TM domain-containing protein [Sphingobium sp.]|nr:glycine zipper 2TM domain-containing protein [Sphingobium sp.]
MTGRTFKKLGIALALGATTLGAVAPAQAHDHGRHNGWYKHQRYDDRDYDRYYDRYGYEPRYENRVIYRNSPPVYYRGQNYCGRSDGAAGTIIGAIAGGLIGNSLAGRHGDRTTGTIIGGAVGAVAGRAIDKSDDRCR